MSGSINKVILVGNLGANPEVKTMQDGFKIVSLSVATSESWKDKNTGERKENTEWHRVVIMNEQLGSIAERFLKKGSKVYLEGQLQTRKYTDQQGQEKYSTEVLLSRYRGELTLLDHKRSDEHMNNENSLQNYGNSSNNFALSTASNNRFSNGHVSQNILNDDIPF